MVSPGDDDLPHKSLSDAQLELLYLENAEEYTDAKVTCKGAEWKVQQSILCTRCPFFKVCFKSGSFKEGESRIVDFPDDEPYAVEALLIYLYTLEYQSRKSERFEEPVKEVDRRILLLPEHKSRIRVSKLAGAEKLATSSTRYKLRSHAPEYLWQERMALYQIAHRLDLKPLCQTVLRCLSKEIDQAILTSNVGDFIEQVYGLDHPEAQRLRGEVVAKIAEQKMWRIGRWSMDSVVHARPRFASDLIEAMGKKGMERQNQILVKQGEVVSQAEELNSCRQEITLQKAQAKAQSDAAAALEKKATDCRKKLAVQRKEKNQLKKDLSENLEKMAQLKEDAAERADEIVQLKAEAMERADEISGRDWAISRRTKGSKLVGRLSMAPNVSRPVDGSLGT